MICFIKILIMTKNNEIFQAIKHVMYNLCPLCWSLYQENNALNLSLSFILNYYTQVLCLSKYATLFFSSIIKLYYCLKCQFSFTLSIIVISDRNKGHIKRSSAVPPPRPPPPRMFSQTERELIRPSNFLKQPFFIYISDPLIT